MRRPAFWEDLGSRASGMGDRRRTLQCQKAFFACEIPLPPLTEQRRIVARIEELAAQINEARNLRQQTAEEAKLLFSQLAHIRLEGSSTNICLEDVCKIITDGTHQTPRYVEDGYTFLSAQHVKPFRFMPEQHRKVSFEDYHSCITRAKPHKGDVLLTRVGAGIGEAAMIDRDIDFAFYVSLALIRPNIQQVLPEFLVYWLNSSGGLAQARRQTLGKGHSQGNLNLKLLRKFRLPLLPIPEQHRIIADLDVLRDEIETLRAMQTESIGELDALLPSILDKAFKGQL